MSYYVFTPDSLKMYIESHQLYTHVDAISEIGNGNLNFVYLIEADGKKIIAKQAVPYLRIAGEGWPLSQNRMKYEIMASNLYNDIVPGLSPKILHYDFEMNLIIMEYLDSYSILRQWIMESKPYDSFIGAIAEFMIETHFSTSVFGMESLERQKLMHTFSDNTELCKLSEEFVFTFPFSHHPSNSVEEHSQELHTRIITNSRYKNNLLKLKYLFVTKKEAVIHGDLHIGSIMYDGDNTKVIDPEFSFYGPIAFDPAKLVSNLLMACIAQQHNGKNDTSYQRYIIDSVFSFMNRYCEGLEKRIGSSRKGIIYDEYAASIDPADFIRYYIDNLISEIVGFAGASIGRRQFGIAGVHEIRGLEPFHRAKAEEKAAALSVLLVESYETIDTVEHFRTVIENFFEKL